MTLYCEMIKFVV